MEFDPRYRSVGKYVSHGEIQQRLERVDKLRPRAAWAMIVFWLVWILLVVLWFKVYVF
jgi:hypothetical protein